MKKLLYILLLFPLFISCSSDDDFKYSSEQLDMLNKLQGRWIHMAGVNEDKEEYIVFHKYLDEPNFDIIDFVVMGKCEIKEYKVSSSDFYTFEAYYWIDTNAETLRFYDINKKERLESISPSVDTKKNMLTFYYKDPNHLGSPFLYYFKQ